MSDLVTGPWRSIIISFFDKNRVWGQSVFTSPSFSSQLHQIGPDEEPEEAASSRAAALPFLRSRRRLVRQTLRRAAQQSQKSGIDH